ncbi:MAG: deoxyribose-phosphate aldolase [bacterium]|nr:deoxyribose-phosphate aldolase [bacterium]
MNARYEDIAGMIDHSLLHPTLTDAQMEEGCLLARRLKVASVCVKPCFVSRARELLKGSEVRVGTVIGFPHGGHATETKRQEALDACRNGAVELDMVVNIGKVLSEDWDNVKADIAAVQEVASDHGAIVKVIFENCYLQDPHKIELCEICSDLAVAFVKTSTGFGTSGATDEDIMLMRKHCPPTVQIKAAGGIRSLGRALRVRELGCTRFGATATAQILDELKATLGEHPERPRV